MLKYPCFLGCGVSLTISGCAGDKLGETKAQRNSSNQSLRISLLFRYFLQYQSYPPNLNTNILSSVRRTAYSLLRSLSTLLRLLRSAVSSVSAVTMAAPSTTTSTLSQQEIKTLEQTRQRLFQLSNSLASLQHNILQADPLPSWYVVERMFFLLVLVSVFSFEKCDFFNCVTFNFSRKKIMNEIRLVPRRIFSPHNKNTSNNTT